MATLDRRATIALVGIDGAGKTTQARRLTDTLCRHGHAAQYRMAANGRRSLGNTARRFGRRDSVDLLGPRLAIRTETLLRQANLSIANRIDVLVSDRYDVCQYARTRLVAPELEPWVRHRLRHVRPPDILLFLDVAPQVAHHRVTVRGTDSETLTDLAGLYHAYRSLPEAERFVVIDAHGHVDDIGHAVDTAVRSALPELFTDQA